MLASTEGRREILNSPAVQSSEHSSDTKEEERRRGKGGRKCAKRKGGGGRASSVRYNNGPQPGRLPLHFDGCRRLVVTSHIRLTPSPSLWALREITDTPLWGAKVLMRTGWRRCLHLIFTRIRYLHYGNRSWLNRKRRMRASESVESSNGVGSVGSVTGGGREATRYLTTERSRSLVRWRADSAQARAVEQAVAEAASNTRSSANDAPLDRFLSLTPLFARLGSGSDDW